MWEIWALTNHNLIGVQLRNIMSKIEEMDNRNRLGGQRTGKLRQIFLEISSVFAQKTQGGLGNKAKKSDRTCGWKSKRNWAIC